MDQTLSREESKELMQLLDLDMCVWGNLPLMRRRYLIKCKEYHPDKGGDENLMKRLNELYKKLESTLETVYYNSQGEEWTWSNNQVLGYCGEGDCGCTIHLNAYLLGEIYGDMFPSMLIKDWDKCIGKWDRWCSCVLCVLRGRHKARVKHLRRPLVWVQCYCFDCYRKWFGIPLTYESFQWWGKILEHTPYGAVHI
ncbi:small T antigen [Porcine polyomavirus]|uniref:small T antigen n=1 Tax=Porcine polyomavirus TaxID=2126099 RepID=UPI000D2181DC|nr:small T antigen [Porcine polyomavirus]AVO64599.1 small T antigen [Porcine polyomavirus]